MSRPGGMLQDVSGRRALVVGYGSIGARHARLLAELGCDVAVVSAREVAFPQRYPSLARGWSEHQPDYVVLANATDRHHATMSELAALGHTGDVLVEKPIFDRVVPVPSHAFRQTRVAYNLRFHPVVMALREELVGQAILSVHAYVGQYLPSWRPDTDYRESYSAHADQGGGALLDLSHDLDYLGWVAGGWQRVAAIGGRMSTLEITSDDVFSLLYESERCRAIGVQLNYLDRLGRRRIIVNTADHTYEADLVRGLLYVDREERRFEVERDTSYKAMHAAMLAGAADQACSLEEGLATLALCDAAREAALSGHWRMR
jgi:predicted dehydrogenase